MLAALLAHTVRRVSGCRRVRAPPCRVADVSSVCWACNRDLEARAVRTRRHVLPRERVKACAPSRARQGQRMRRAAAALAARRLALCTPAPLATPLRCAPCCVVQPATRGLATGAASAVAAAPPPSLLPPAAAAALCDSSQGVCAAPPPLPPPPLAGGWGPVDAAVALLESVHAATGLPWCAAGTCGEQACSALGRTPCG